MSYSTSIIDQLSLPVLFLLTVGIVLLSIELGWRIGTYKREQFGEKLDRPIGATVGATLGLLAFLLAFSFGMAENRYDTRKQVVFGEANAIGTTYLRVDFIPEHLRPLARDLLRQYTVLRAGGAAVITSPQGIATAAELQDQLWAIAVQAEQAEDTPATSLFVSSLNEMIDYDTTRLAMLRNRIPDTIWMMLIVVTIFSMLALGYEFGRTGARNWVVTIILVMAFTAVLVLIADLDRPATGLVKVSQQPLFDLLARMGAGR